MPPQWCPVAQTPALCALTLSLHTLSVSQSLCHAVYTQLMPLQGPGKVPNMPPSPLGVWQQILAKGFLASTEPFAKGTSLQTQNMRNKKAQERVLWQTRKSSQMEHLFSHFLSRSILCHLESSHTELYSKNIFCCLSSSRHSVKHGKVLEHKYQNSKKE